MTTHLEAAIRHLEEALKALMTPFAPSRKEELSWMSLLRDLGLDVDIEEAERALERERERLKLFKEEGT